MSRLNQQDVLATLYSPPERPGERRVPEETGSPGVAGGRGLPSFYEVWVSAKRQAEFYSAYAESLAAESAPGGAEEADSGTAWVRLVYPPGQWTRQATLANAFRIASQHAALVDAGWATKLAVRAAKAYIAAGLPFGLYLLTALLDDEILQDNVRERKVLDGKWMLESRLAEADPGSGGTVWRATRVGDTGQKYVVKRVAADSEVIGRLLSHERRAGRIRSRHVVQIVAYGETEDWKYIVSPLYKPGSLAQNCGPDQKDRPNLKWCAQRMAEVLTGLMDASKLWLMHLDIKPQNIVLDGDHARIIDWGLSRNWNAAETSRPMPGTPFYACPEQVIWPHKGLDSPLADLYGVGATFYWLITGEQPLMRQVRETDPRKLNDEYARLLHEKRRPTPVSALVPAVPSELSTLISRWLSIDPAERKLRETKEKNALRAARDELGRMIDHLPKTPVGRVTAPQQIHRRGDAKGGGL